jgi:hypothetical protein
MLGDICEGGSQVLLYDSTVTVLGAAGSMTAGEATRQANARLFGRLVLSWTSARELGHASLNFLSDASK